MHSPVLKASILIVNYKVSGLVEKCLDSIREHTSDYEVLVHDNSPPNANLGFARANNLLIRKARGDYIVLLNPDTWVTEGWVEKLIDTAELYTKIVFVMSKTLCPTWICNSADK